MKKDVLHKLKVSDSKEAIENVSVRKLQEADNIQNIINAYIEEFEREIKENI